MTCLLQWHSHGRAGCTTSGYMEGNQRAWHPPGQTVTSQSLVNSQQLMHHVLHEAVQNKHLSCAATSIATRRSARRTVASCARTPSPGTCTYNIQPPPSSSPRRPSLGTSQHCLSGIDSVGAGLEATASIRGHAVVPGMGKQERCGRDLKGWGVSSAARVHDAGRLLPASASAIKTPGPRQRGGH